ncbi:hypothetical protein Q1695_005401 [Nippostrongylus brasiliensis]|nr:hypothetical protein Q1695_005401 [Nippostrongylus brasiliensis]
MSRCLSADFRRRRTDQFGFCDDIDDDFVGFDAKTHRSVARHTASGIELLMVYLEEEIRRARLFIRNCGLRIRRFCAASVHVDCRRLTQLLAALIDSQSTPMPVEMEGLNDDEALIFNTVPLRSRWKPPKFTFNDIYTVLTSDEIVEDGIIHAYTIRSPAWSRLPSPIASRQSETDIRDFQIFNRPMKMTIPTEDDDDRFSLPSTMATDQDLKIQSLEAQLAQLSKQMQLLLATKGPQAAPMIEPTPPLSDDEGKGPSLYSPTDTEKSMLPRPSENTAPKSIPPPPPPPPPPPSLLSTTASVTSINKTDSTGKRTVLQMLNKSTNVEHEALPVRPSASDLRTVQLKKTNTVRSPGGTPVARQSRVPPIDQANYLANALREKFRSLQDCLSEHEDDVNTSWIEDEL